MASFSSALASGQLGPLLAQFGLPEAAQTAAGKGGKFVLIVAIYLAPQRFKMIAEY